MPSPVFLSNPSPGFTVSAILRGAQLMFVGGFRALQNPDLFHHEFYSIVTQTIAWSLMMEVTLRVCFMLIRGVFWVFNAPLQPYVRLAWVLNELLQFRQLLVLGFRNTSHMDSLFLQSLEFVDKTNLKKHPGTKRLFSPLSQYKVVSYAGRKPRKRLVLQRMATHTAWRLMYFFTATLLSHIPYFGSLVFPAAAFVNLRSTVGSAVACGIFMVGIFVPAWWIKMFLSIYWSSRNLTSTLLEPFFERLPFSPTSKRLWLRNRQGILFGFGITFCLLLRVPYVGLVSYGFACASASYLLTKISDPIPRPGDANIGVWCEEQVVWHKLQKGQNPL